MRKTFSYIVLSLVILALVGCYGSQKRSSTMDSSRPQMVVEEAATAVRFMRGDRDFESLGFFLKNAKGALVFPDVVKAAFIIGGKGGTGVLLAKDENGNWGSPAFYTMGGGNIGLQAGVEKAALVMVIMNEKTLRGVLETGVTLGADASYAAGNEGAKGEASTLTGFTRDVYYFANVGGLFAGVSLDGSVIKVRRSLNEAYYGSGATPMSIVVERRHDNPDAKILKDSLS